MKKFTTISDIGSIKITDYNVSLYFDNGYGDGTNTVCIVEGKEKKPKDNFIIGMFDVKHLARLCYSDCGDESLYEFRSGRYYVYRPQERKFYIYRMDDCLN